MANDLPNMTRAGRQARQAAWEAGQHAAGNIWDTISEGQPPEYSTEETVEYLRGLGQYFTALAHDLTRARQEGR